MECSAFSPSLGGCCCEIRELRLAKLGICVLDGSWLLALSKIPVESKLHNREAGGTKMLHFN